MSGEQWWHAPDCARSDSVMFDVRDLFGPMVAIWAGGELDPAYLSPAAARRAADEWPVILRRLADEAESKVER